ncbi:MAG: ABC transporter permease [Oscillospiraceae bacterium]|nr:ABC transporter permease [Oscillospiraceae bacterium]
MKNKFLGIPYIIWMAIFVVVPMFLIVGYAFTTREGGFSTGNFSNMLSYAGVFGDSFLLAIIATLVCLLIGYPISYWMTREGPGVKRIALVVLMLPMWMNFLLRTYAWMSLLENTGILNELFSAIGLFKLINAVTGSNIDHFPMINTKGAVVLGMVYNYLPFMILPIYNVIDKIDARVIEAAQDLGANSANVFRRVIFPLSLPGVISGITMVFIPSVSTFAISKLLGGGKTLLLGDLIEMQFYGNSYNPYLGSAVSLVMMVIVLVCMAIMNRFGDGEETAVML